MDHCIIFSLSVYRKYSGQQTRVCEFCSDQTSYKSYLNLKCFTVEIIYLDYSPAHSWGASWFVSNIITGDSMYDGLYKPWV